MSVGCAISPDVAAGERQVILEHAGHFVDVLAHRLDLRTVADQRQFELEAGEDGAQIVRDAGQHRGALLDRSLDAGLHLQERLRRAPHLAAPRGRKFGASRPLPKLSAASANRRIGLIWLRRNSTATIRRIDDVPSIQKIKISELEA